QQEGLPLGRRQFAEHGQQPVPLLVRLELVQDVRPLRPRDQVFQRERLLLAQHLGPPLRLVPLRPVRQDLVRLFFQREVRPGLLLGQLPRGGVQRVGEPRGRGRGGRAVLDPLPGEGQDRVQHVGHPPLPPVEPPRQFQAAQLAAGVAGREAEQPPELPDEVLPPPPPPVPPQPGARGPQPRAPPAPPP